MVFFNCNGCGEALKKNQVEKHSLRCRQCQVLSCVDCGKDFWGNDYQSHTKCISEEEKYCGKGYVPKVNKGEVKQEQWIEKVQAAIEKSASNPKLRGVLERLKDYPNIPRKKIKFENFLKNSLRVSSQPLISQVWDTLMAATSQPQEETGILSGTGDPSVNGLGSHEKNVTTDHRNGDTPSCEERKEEVPEHKLSKRERKEERRKKTSKKEKKEKNVENGETEKAHKKGKKRKHEEIEEAGAQENSAPDTNTEHIDNTQPEKKKKKKKHKSLTEDGKQTTDENNPSGEREQNLDGSKDDPERTQGAKKKKKKSKFNWEATVISVLKSKGEISVKRLSKKVLSEFAAQDAANYSQENLRAKFDRKLNRIPQVVVLKDRVRLK